MVTISVPLGGYVKETHMLPGLHIKKGESIAEIEGQQYIQIQQDYLTIKTKLVYLEKEYARQKLLNESKAGSDKVFQQTESDFMSMKIELKSLFEKLKLVGINPDKLNDQTISKSIQVFSPIDGFVSKVNVNIGKYVNPSDILFELVNPSDIHLALTVFEKDIDKLFVGQKLLAYTNQNPQKKYLCEIILIGKDISLDKQLIVHCHFEDYDQTLVPGMYLNALIELKSTDSDAIEEAAVVEFEGRHYVFESIGNSDYKMIEVETGITQNGFTIINNAASLKNKKLVINDAYRLLMKLKNSED
jgi:cobalt-zinc-cadmium efflux system membrane fusion protein